MGNDLAGKVALVTGASKGIGAGIATAFAQAGANVAVGYARDHEGAERVVGEIKAAGGRAITVHGHLAKTADIEAMVAKAVATFGPIDTLVNNAAVFDFKALSDIDEAHFHHIFNTNVLGLLTTTKVAVANFNSAGGSVINISSLSALGNAPSSAVYASSKAAVNAITKVLALELAERKIRLNAIDLLGLPRVGVDDGGNPHGFRGTTLNGSRRFSSRTGSYCGTSLQMIDQSYGKYIPRDTRGILPYVEGFAGAKAGPEAHAVPISGRNTARNGASHMKLSLNQILPWLREMDALRRVLAA